MGQRPVLVLRHDQRIGLLLLEFILTRNPQPEPFTNHSAESGSREIPLGEFRGCPV